MTTWWHVLSQGYAQSIAFTMARSKYQSPTDFAIPYTKHQETKMVTSFFYLLKEQTGQIWALFIYYIFKRKGLKIPSFFCPRKFRVGDSSGLHADCGIKTCMVKLH